MPKLLLIEDDAETASYCSQINSFHELELGGFHWASS